MIKWLTLLLIPATLLFAAACGDDDDDDDDAEDVAEDVEEEVTDDDDGAAADGEFVEVEAVEFQFNYDESAVNADIAGFSFVNNGEQEHELQVFGLAEDVDLEAALMEETEALPEGVEQVAGTFAPPGEEGEPIEFTQPLEPGRYVMLCFIPDEESGQPHFALGMMSEFTIE